MGHRTFLLCEENAPDAIERLGRSSIYYALVTTSTPALPIMRMHTGHGEISSGGMRLPVSRSTPAKYSVAPIISERDADSIAFISACTAGHEP